MDKVSFDCNGNNAPAYSCDKPGDNSGEYYRCSDVEARLQALEECRELVERTVAHADLLLLDLPPEMVEEFSQALAKISPQGG